MTLDEFINHLKHRNLVIRIYFLQDVEEDEETSEPVYDGTVGTYTTSLIRSHISKCDIVRILPFSIVNGFSITVDKDGAV